MFRFLDCNKLYSLFLISKLIKTPNIMTQVIRFILDTFDSLMSNPYTIVPGMLLMIVFLGLASAGILWLTQVIFYFLEGRIEKRQALGDRNKNIKKTTWKED